MPKVIKRSTAGVKQRFAIYDGPTPTPGVYRGVIVKAVGQKSSGDNIMLTNVVKFEARPGDPRAQYDGYTAFVRIVWGDAESLKEREQAYYLAVAGKESADVAFAGDPTKFKAGDKQETPITKVGGKAPENTVVLVRLRPSQDPDYPLDADGIYPTRDDDRGAGKQVKGQTKAVADEEDEVEDEDLEPYDEDALKGMSLAALRKILVEEFDAATEAGAAKLKSKAKLIAAILEAQDEAEEDDDEDLDDEDDEDLDEEEEEEEEEDDEEEEDRESEIDAELAEMSRDDVKRALKKRDASRKFKTSDTEDALKEELKGLMLQDPPF